MKSKTNYSLAIVCLAASVQISSAQMNIPILHVQEKSFAVAYHAIEKTHRSPEELSRVIEAKRKQYEAEVAKGSKTESQAADILRSIEATPKESVREYDVQFNFFPDRTLVTASWREGGDLHEAWNLMMADEMILYGWQGGDTLDLAGGVEPYSSASALLPILPLQLRGFKTFVDLHGEGNSPQAKMICASTSDDRYFDATLSFREGHLAVADAPGLETWNYDRYRDANPPLPAAIHLARLFAADQKPQIETEFSMVNAKLDSRTLNDLIPDKSIVVIDRRTDPIKRFEYFKDKGSILNQARKETPTLESSSRYEQSAKLNLTKPIALGIGLLLIAGIAAAMIIRRK